MTRTLEERLEAFIERGTGCWRWRGYVDEYGYGRIGVGKKTCYAHRVAYEMKRGPIPRGATLDHLCRTRDCVRVDHLEPVSRGTNVLRGQGLTAKNKRAIACYRGHIFTGSNTRRYGRRRICRKCAGMHRKFNKIRGVSS